MFVPFHRDHNADKAAYHPRTSVLLHRASQLCLRGQRDLRNNSLSLISFKRHLKTFSTRLACTRSAFGVLLQKNALYKFTVIININIRGPRTDPCGTEHSM